MAAEGYRDLLVWQKAMDLVVEVYRVTDAFPSHELYGLASQLRRAIVSVPSNIAEGEGRRATGDFKRFLAIAQGSLREVETQLLIAQRVGYVDAPQVTTILERSAEVGRMLHGLIRSLK